MKDNVVQLRPYDQDTLESLYAKYLRETLSNLRLISIDSGSVMVMIGIVSSMSIAFKAQFKVEMSSFLISKAHELETAPHRLIDVVEQIILELES